MSDRVPSYGWIEPPIFSSQDVAEPWVFRLMEETAPGSKRFAPADLTGLDALLSLVRETAPGSDEFVDEIIDEDMDIAAPTSGIMTYQRPVDLDLEVGDHLGEIALYQGSTCVARVPGGRRYFRVIVGRKLGA